MDPFFVGLLIGFGGGVGAMVSLVFRANKMPTGRTAKLLGLVGKKND